MILEIYTQKQRIEQMLKIAQSCRDTEIQSHWARYLCVLISGFIENSVELCLSEYSRRNSNDVVANFVGCKLRGFQNPKIGPIIELFGSFNATWRGDLESATDGKLGDSINSIVGNRHSIAHGQSVSLSLGSLTAYYRDALKVIDLLHRTCGV